MLIRKYLLLLTVLLAAICGPGHDSYSEERSSVTGITVVERDGTTEIEIKGSAPFNYTVYKPSDPYQLVVELQNTDLGKFTKKLTIDRAGVLEITPAKDADDPDASKLKIAFTVPVEVEPVYKDNSLVLAFENPEAGETASSKAEEAPEASKTEGEASAERYTGEKINIDFQDAELHHIFRLISDISGYNIVVSPDVKGKFSMKLIDVPWDQALEVILRNYGLSKTFDGNIIRIAPTAVLAKEEEEIARAKESMEKSGNLITKVYPINFASVADVKKAIDTAKILTNRGFISVDERTSSVIIKDVDQKHEEYGNLISALDVPTPQVSIDARIVEVTTNFTKELGIQWGALLKPTPQTQISGITPPLPGNTGSSGFFSSNPLLVNLPAAVGQGAGGSLGIGYISAKTLRALDIQLSAMESTGKGRIISNPRVITMDNQKAKIMQGKKIPYETTSQEGTQTAFVDAALELLVTPHITPDGTIFMNIEAKKNEADFSRTSFSGVPTIDTNEVSTQILIKDGDTLALGGIFKTNNSKDVSAVPGLGRIFGLGWLFKNEKDVTDSTELLIFITPKIVK
ncbi:MAG: type IV pilus secretin family protein [Nitrospiraceae bacterium]|nr:MAG: type IV pilus secretin family protein [Nitrospiraceae bacterium]